MQYGSITRETRKTGPDVWSYRWREPGPNQERVHRRLVIGTLRQFNEESAIDATAGLRTEINSPDSRISQSAMTLGRLAEHFRQRELGPESVWKSHATKYGYQVHLNKWIVPRWGEYPLAAIKAVEVEHWLGQLSLSPSTRAKLRAVMKVLYNHARPWP